MRSAASVKVSFMSFKGMVLSGEIRRAPQGLRYKTAWGEESVRYLRLHDARVSTDREERHRQVDAR